MDTDTFITTLYVMVDDFCKVSSKEYTRPGPEASLSRSEVVTLAVFGQWGRFLSERDFYRYAVRHLKGAFPTLPHRSQLNRLMRYYSDDIVGFFLYMKDLLGARNCAYEALDCSCIPVRDAKRRGQGWLAGIVGMAWSNHLGWYEGFHIITSVNPEGIITGFGVAPATSQDQPMAEWFLALRKYPDPRIPSVGAPALGSYVTDKGFVGRELHLRWAQMYDAEVICPPKKGNKYPWPKALRSWLAGIRQIVETVYHKLHKTFRLDEERPHTLGGFQMRLAAKMALHNFCIWLNRQLGRSNLEFADLLAW